MRRTSQIMGLVLVSMMALGPASARDDKEAELARPKLFDDVVACREITDEKTRLACYDQKVAALDEAQKKEEIILTDKAAVKEAKRGLFGFSIPKLKIFGSDDEGVSEIETTIASASLPNGGKLTITLEDGARWLQIDTQAVFRAPKAGTKVRIRKAAMGSYFVNIDGARAIRMKRID